MAAALLFLLRRDATALATVLADALAELDSGFKRHARVAGDLQAVIGRDATETALAKVRKTIKSDLGGVWPDLTDAERRAEGRCWDEVDITRPDIGDAQFERVRRQLAGGASHG